MIGTGPLGGYAAETGLVIASTDPLAADVVGDRLLGFDVQAIRHLWEAKRLGIGASDLDKMEFPAMSLKQAIDGFTEAVFGKKLKFQDARLGNWNTGMLEPFQSPKKPNHQFLRAKVLLWPLFPQLDTRNRSAGRQDFLQDTLPERPPFYSSIFSVIISIYLRCIILPYMPHYVILTVPLES